MIIRIVKTYLIVSIILIVSANCKKAKNKNHQKEVLISLSKGLQCYNCLSFDHPGCWDPDHPAYSNITVPSVDCHMEGVHFTCIVITAEAATLVDNNQNTGPVRARTCVPIKDTNRQISVSYNRCEKLAKELISSEVFSKVKVIRPKCSLCKTPLCTEPLYNN